MTSPSLYNSEPIEPQKLRRLAPFLFDSPRVVGVPASLTLFGFSVAEQEMCLDAIDLCGVGCGLQAVELYLKDFEDFIVPRNEIEDGLSLVRVPDQFDEETVTWLAISMASLASRTRLNVVPVLPTLHVREALLPSISAYCPALLSCESDVVDFATVISAFLRLPRSVTSESFICPGCDRRAAHSSVQYPLQDCLKSSKKLPSIHRERDDAMASFAASMQSSLCI